MAPVIKTEKTWHKRFILNPANAIAGYSPRDSVEVRRDALIHHVHGELPLSGTWRRWELLEENKQPANRLPRLYLVAHMFRHFEADKKWRKDAVFIIDKINRTIEYIYYIRNFLSSRGGPRTNEARNAVLKNVGVYAEDILFLQYIRDLTISVKNMYTPVKKKTTKKKKKSAAKKK